MTPGCSAFALLMCALLAQGQDIAITHVTVVDTETGRAQRDMTVIISGDHISAVGESRRLRPPRGAQVVNGRDKFLIPGLWDMHVHMRANWDPKAVDTSAWTFYAPNFIANGVTGVRSMWDILPAIQKLRADDCLGPRGGASHGHLRQHAGWSASFATWRDRLRRCPTGPRGRGPDETRRIRLCEGLLGPVARCLFRHRRRGQEGRSSVRGPRAE